MHPKNSTPPSPTQHSLLTRATDFGTVPGENRHPFAINAGIEVEEALNFACSLMASVDSIVTISMSSGVSDADLSGIRFLAQAGRALVLASLPAIENGGAQ